MAGGPRLEALGTIARRLEPNAVRKNLIEQVRQVMDVTLTADLSAERNRPVILPLPA